MTHPLSIALKHLLENPVKACSLYLFVIDTKTEHIDFIHYEDDWERYYLEGDIEFSYKNKWEQFYNNNSKRHLSSNNCETEYVELSLEYLTGQRPFCKCATIFGKSTFVSEKIAFPLALELTKQNPIFENFFNLSKIVRKVELEKTEDFTILLNELKDIENYRQFLI
ncbi:MAG: hypothetical protein FWG90_01730 [Oscillospiraceae bacterium]|nr:hypothetical protein [Oscillospiraceae bacterium]